LTLLYGSPALALLLRLKLRGLVRRQWRRLRTPKGFALTAIGLAAFGVWFASLAFSFTRPPQPLAPEEAALRVRAMGAVLLLISLSTAVANRGLYLPKSEIERLFSAPVGRADLVRYRLLANGLRNLLGGIVLGLFGARRMPEPLLAFAGIVLAMQTLPVVNQVLAIAFGGLERRAAAVLRRGGNLLLLLGVVALAALVLALLTESPLERMPLAGPWLAELFARDRDPFAHPVLGYATLPLLPWARMIAAGTAGQFLPWCLACLALHALLAELCARVPIDFRELSLQTSARAAARMARLRRGGGAAATRASKGAAHWRIPWLFGRGPVGAIAWRKSAGMARKAKGALWIALIALAFITFLASQIVNGPPEEEALYTPSLIGLLGTVYLCSGLRFDFREELERMDVIRAWPIAPARVFLATLLPEVVLVTVLVTATVLLQAALAHGLSHLLLGVVACLPFFVFTWVALDNLVFLVAPVRFVPGQDGFVQNAGRRMVQAALLLALFLVFTACGSLGFLGGYLGVSEVLGGPEAAARAAGIAALVAVLAAGDGLLVLLGGAVLRRFDVARDRG
jgi:hypothetical protein